MKLVKIYANKPFKGIRFNPGFNVILGEPIEKKNKDNLKPGMVDVPVDIDDRVGFLKLQSMGIEIDTLTEEQYNYIKNNFEIWKEDTEQVDDVLFMGVEI